MPKHHGDKRGEGEPIFLNVGKTHELCRFPTTGQWSLRLKLADDDVSHQRYLNEHEVAMVEAALAYTPSHVAPNPLLSHECGKNMVCSICGSLPIASYGPNAREGEGKIEDCAPSTTPRSGDAYFIVGYEDTPGFAIARSKEEVRAALCDVIYGGSLKPEDEETKEELDSHMEWFEDDDRWSIDRSHWSISYEIGGIEAWRFPAKLLACALSATRDRRPWNQQDADMLAAAVDDAIRRGVLDPRSQIADCRLDYGRPFSPEEVAAHLAKRRHGKNAANNRPDGGKA